MKYVQQLSIADLQAFTTEIRNLALLEYNPDTDGHYLNPDKELDSGTLGELVNVLHRFDLVPDKVTAVS